MTKYVQLSEDTTSIITEYATPQLITADKPGYTTVADNDARYPAFLNTVAGQTSYRAAIGAGITLVSTGTSSLNGIYAIDQTSQQNITAEALYIRTTALIASGGAAFTTGTSTAPWTDLSGAPHTFTTTQFTNFAEAVARYIRLLQTALAVTQAGGAWSAPSTTITIP